MKRVVLIVIGVVLLLVSAPLLIGGLIATAAGAGDDPAIEGRLGRVGSNGYALVSDALDIQWDYPFADRFDLRVGARSAYPDVPVFIGYGDAASVDAYLAGVPHTVVYDLGSSARSGGEVDVPGSRDPEPPGEQGFWLVQASGSQVQEIPLPSAPGSFRLVVMNADASRGVEATLYGAFTLPFLLPLGVGTLVVGALLLAAAIALIVWGIRSKPTPSAVAAGHGPASYPDAPAPYPWPSGQGPVPQPPAAQPPPTWQQSSYPQQPGYSQAYPPQPGYPGPQHPEQPGQWQQPSVPQSSAPQPSAPAPESPPQPGGPPTQAPGDRSNPSA